MKLAIALALLATPAAALSMDGLTLANSLGSVLASEEPCGLSYDHNAIREFMQSRPEAADLGFAPQLVVQTRGIAGQIRQMTDSQLVTHCSTVSISADTFGFIGPSAPSQ